MSIFTSMQEGCKQPDAPLKDLRPKVRLPGDNYLLSDTAFEIGRILAGKEIFTRSGLVFYINDRRDGLSLMTPETLRTWIEDWLVCYRVKKVADTESVVHFKRTITQSDADGILNSPQFLNQLQRIERLNTVRMPVRRQNGWIELLPEGYDLESKTFTVNSVPFPERAAVETAKATINQLLSEFHFGDNGRSKSVAISALFSVFGAGLLPDKALRPCFIFLANAEGAGKTLMVKISTVPVLGYAPTGTKPKDEDEMKKLLFAAALEAKQVVFFDNLKTHLASAALEGFVTAQDLEGRVLGQTKCARCANNAWVFITGNGCTVSPDMRRRSLFCELFLNVERAEDRVFRQLLEVPQLLEMRSEILSALWVLIKEWNDSMEPEPSRSNSSFPEWSKVIGGIVEFSGWGCPLETPQIEASADTDGDDMRSLVAGAIPNGDEFKAFTFEEIVQVARDKGLFERTLPMDGELDAKTKSIFGKLLKRYDERPVGEHRFSLQGKGRTRRFVIERSTNPTK